MERKLTLMCFVHEFEKLVDNCLEELPMRFEEAWVLTDDVHDVGCDHSLVVFTSLDLAETKQVLDNSDQKSLLCLLV